jgi:Ca2+-binding EF-hand superfamily protein
MSTISSVSSYASSITSASTQRKNRPDPAQMAENLFSKLDTKSQGYLEKSDLQSAFDKLSGTGSSASVDDVFKQLDGNGDGKVTKDEMSTSLQKLADELDSQFNQARMNGGMPPPPPPPQGSDAGFTKDELKSQLSEIGSSRGSDSKRSDLMTRVANNFEAADTDSDGKVSFKEAIAYDQKTSTVSSTSANPTSAAPSTTDQAVMKRIMELMQAYANDTSGKNSLLSTLSISA